MRFPLPNAIRSGQFALVLSLSLVLGFAIGPPLVAQSCTAPGRTSPALVPGIWTMVSLPCNLGIADTVADVWGDDFGVENYDNPGVPDDNPTWVVWERDELNDTYVHLALDDFLGNSAQGDPQGQGYWILNTLGGSWTVEGTETVPNESGPHCRGGSPNCYGAPLTPMGPVSSMNLLGNPWALPLPWSNDITFGDAGLSGTRDQAVFKELIGPEAWVHNGAAYITLGDGEDIPPFSGFWIEVIPVLEWFLVEPQINFPEPVGPFAPASQPTVRDLAPEEWEVRLIASAPAAGLEDPGNLVGQLAGSVPGYDRRDLRALDPFAAPYLDLVFPHEDWEGRHSSEYNRDYHAKTGADWDRWQFIVKSDDPNRDVTLSWEGEREMHRMWLRDDLTGELIKATRDGELQTYSFSMEGELERSFSWAMAPKNR